jgi:hypothetical protein
MGQTSVPETLVIHQKLTPGYNPKTFKHIIILLQVYRIWFQKSNIFGQMYKGHLNTTYSGT